MAEICVVGAGPAGCVFATRMAQFGHDVHLIERSRFPRPRLGESLTPGVLPLLRSAGFDLRVEAAFFSRVREVSIAWGGPPRLREDPQEQGLIADRGLLDRTLLETARSFGVRVHQPAEIVGRAKRPAGWRLDIRSETGRARLDVDFVAQATGRGGAPAGRIRPRGPATIAVHAYWRGSGLSRPTVEAGDEVWFWGVPLPDGTCNLLVFVDPRRLRRLPGSGLSQRYLRLLSQSSLMKQFSDAQIVADARATDATPYLGDERVDATTIRVGDAALAIDPISSSGVQKAVQSALSGAVVANTLLRRPASAEAARQFYDDHLTGAAERHALWSAEYYGLVAAKNDRPFWSDRAARRPAAPPEAPAPPFDAHAMAATPVELSKDLKIAAAPCLDGDFVEYGDAVSGPGLESPVVYVAGRRLAPLLRRLGAGGTPLQIARSWSDEAPIETGLAIAAWLIQHRLLVAKVPASCPRC